MSPRTAGLLGPMGATLPMVAAPMAGGPSRPELVIAAAAAGGTGFLAAGYKSPEELAAQILQVQRATPRLGVNLFVPHQVPIDIQGLADHREALQRWLDEHASRPHGRWAAAVELPELGDLRGVPGAGAGQRSRQDARQDSWDDSWEQKLEVLESHSVPLVSLTFGLPESAEIERLQATGARVLQTVTSAPEALAAVRAGVDGLIVQSSAAGAHSGTWTPQREPAHTELLELLGSIGTLTARPIWAAGGLATAEDVHAALQAGAEAAVLGTALLRSPESGADPTHKQALAAPPQNPRTVLTTAFTGRPARALRNSFTDALTEAAPLGFPALHQLSAPLRRAAAAASDPEGLNLWAGTGFAAATDEPAGQVLRRLAGSHRLR